MNPTRKTKVEDLEAAQQVRARLSNLAPDEQIREKLSNLSGFVQQLAQTDAGKADLDRRTRMFGPCKRAAGESNRDYYGRLRRWLDRDLMAESVSAAER